MWPVALLVFFASITVPVLKLIGLTFLLITVQRRSRWRLRDRSVMYRIIEQVGRWSMVDIFMISILGRLRSTTIPRRLPRSAAGSAR
jgi:paraquat-inducible protein A